MYDEAFEPGGRPRMQYADLLAWLGEHDLAALAESLSKSLRQRGVTFGASRDGMFGDPGERERALDHLDDLVIKPRGEMGGEGVVIWSQSNERERRRALERLNRQPLEHVAQRRVELSCHPTLCDGRLEPRRVDLRPYVIRSGAGEWALPGGLTRVALEPGSLIVNSGQGGGAKDTWVVA